MKKAAKKKRAAPEDDGYDVQKSVGQRIMDVAAICRLRKECQLRCRNCVFYNNDIKDCSKKEDLAAHAERMKGKKVRY